MQLILVQAASSLDPGDKRIDDETPLSAEGRRQAAALARDLHDVDVVAVYSGPAISAVETAEPIAVSHGLPILREPSLSAAPPVDRPTELSNPALQLAARVGQLATVQEQAWAFVQSLRAIHDNDAIVCVAGELTARTFVARAINLPLDNLQRLHAAPAAQTAIQFRGDRVLVLRLNDTCHLDGL